MNKESYEILCQDLRFRMQRMRKEKGFKQTDMMEPTGLSHNHISAVECGNTPPGLRMLIGYCEKLDVTPNEMLGYDDSLDPELFRELKAMPQKDQRMVLAIIKAIEQNREPD